MGVLKSAVIATVTSMVLGSSALACVTSGDGCVSWSTGAYTGYTNKSHVLSVPGADSMNVTIVGSTEEYYDFVYLYDQTGKLVAALHGNINETVVVKGSKFAVKLLTDDFGPGAGVTVTACKCNGTNCAPPAEKPVSNITKPAATVNGVDAEFAQPTSTSSYSACPTKSSWDPEFHSVTRSVDAEFAQPRCTCPTKSYVVDAEFAQPTSTPSYSACPTKPYWDHEFH